LRLTISRKRLPVLSRRFALGTFAGITLYVHWTFFLLLAFVAFSPASLGSETTGFALALVVSLFACVTLHEYGHAMAARLFGIRTRDITLLPIGGVARLERMPRDPWQEIVVALAGPAVNVVIAISLVIGLRFLGPINPMEVLDGGESLQRFLLVLTLQNIFLCVFNLLPAFPMDGGRVLRALLAMVLPYPDATRVAARIGQVLAILLGISGLLIGSPMIPLLAMFLIIAAASESRQVQLSAQVGGAAVGDAMMRRFRSLPPYATLGELAGALADDGQGDYPVVEHGRLLGMLQRRELVDALQRQYFHLCARDLMQSNGPALDARQPLELALAIAGGRSGALPVTDGYGHVVGLLDPANLLDRLSLRRAARAVADPRYRWHAPGPIQPIPATPAPAPPPNSPPSLDLGQV
jgi:Zn-dependent protease